MDDYVCGFDYVLVDFGRKYWFWSIWAETTGFGRFWPKKVVLVEFDWKKLVLTEETGFGRRWPGKLGFDQKQVVLIDFGRKRWFWSLLAEKNWFWSILAENPLVLPTWSPTSVITGPDRGLTADIGWVQVYS